MPLCTLEQFSVVRKTLLSHKNKLADALWRVAQDEQRDPSQRFQAAAALAEYIPDDERCRKRLGTTSRCTSAYNMGWQGAAENCNWLSKQEGIPEDQWVYQPNGSGGTKTKENWLELLGYRLPTDVEWESACLAGASGSHGFGEPVTLLKHYGWHAANSSGHNNSVQSLLPNDSGLFDMHGNSWEWANPVSVAGTVAIDEKPMEVRQDAKIATVQVPFSA